MRKLVAILITALLMVSCGRIPDGQDHNGFYQNCKECVREITVIRRVFTGKMFVRRRATACLEYVDKRCYIRPEDIDKEWLNEHLNNK